MQNNGGDIPTRSSFDSRSVQFAAACYDQNSLAELVIDKTRHASDKFDRAQWGLTAREWAYAIGMAYAAKLAAKSE